MVHALLLSNLDTLAEVTHGEQDASIGCDLVLLGAAVSGRDGAVVSGAEVLGAIEDVVAGGDVVDGEVMHASPNAPWILGFWCRSLAWLLLRSLVIELEADAMGLERDHGICVLKAENDLIV